MNTENVIAYLTIASTSRRAYYSINNWKENSMKCKDGSEITLLSNASQIDTRELSENAITSAFLPMEFAGFDSVEDLLAENPQIPQAIKLNTVTGAGQPIE